MDRVAIARVWYTYLSERVCGQGSPEYKRLCKLSQWFTPGPCFSGFISLTEDEKKYYKYLCLKGPYSRANRTSYMKSRAKYMRKAS